MAVRRYERRWWLLRMVATVASGLAGLEDDAAVVWDKGSDYWSESRLDCICRRNLKFQGLGAGAKPQEFKAEIERPSITTNRQVIVELEIMKISTEKSWWSRFPVVNKFRGSLDHQKNSK